MLTVAGMPQRRRFPDRRDHPGKTGPGGTNPWLVVIDLELDAAWQLIVQDHFEFGIEVTDYWLTVSV